MPHAVEPLDYVKELTPNRVRWTRSQCDAIREAGILTGRYELIDGEIISKMGQNPPHRLTLILLNAWLIGVFGVLFVQTQATIDVGDTDPDHNSPEPDAAVTREPATAYSDRNPGPGDLVLAVEVSESTLRFDLTTKAHLYARAGISEYWVLDIAARQVVVHRHPDAGRYADVAAYGLDESVATLARPDAPVRVADLFPAARV